MRRVDRFDHAVIAVPDLDSAVSAYRDLGFDVSFGGKHTGRGTHNAIIRFGLDYLELLGIYDAAEERASGGELSDFLERNGGGLVAFALATSSIDELAEAWTADFAPVGAPEPMERVRPDGFRLSWQLLIPGGSPWGKPWPFIIQWDTPDDQRLVRDAPGRHANGASGVAGLTVRTNSVGKLLPLYATDLGLAAETDRAGDAVMSLQSMRIRLATGHEERPTEVALYVSDLRRAADAIGVRPGAEQPLVLPQDHTFGARIVVRAQQL
jgi:catechol 2,3-dioxygenase-like lactoylglutathione lyase family enzyme